jgi:hypothetical protein
MKRAIILFVASVLLLSVSVEAQYTPWLYWTFLPKAQMDEIVGEASGETAWRTISVLNGFNRDRSAAEFKGTFFETQYVIDRLKRYGIEKVDVAAYPGGEAWEAIRGELWEVTPIRQKLASHNDMVPMLVNGSTSTKITGELVWIGQGTVEDIRQAKVEGKIVVTEGNISAVHGEACLRQGALGVIAISQGRPDSGPLELSWDSLGQSRRPPLLLPSSVSTFPCARESF